jgi:signal transduction histidine kinase
LVEVDPTLVGRALGNLLENAERHAGKIDGLVVRGVREGNRMKVRFEVRDRGPGFAPGVLERAFEAFYSGNRGNGEGSHVSLGLGLALVARIARAHGGRAFAENLAGGGALAVVELPAREAS